MSPEEQARLLQEVKEQFTRSVADLLMLKAKVGGAGVSPTMGDYLLDLTRLGVSFYHSVLDLNASYLEKVTSQVAVAESGSKKKRDRERNVIKLKKTAASRDESVAFDVEIENTSSAAGTYRFFVSDFAPVKNTSAEEIIRPPVKIVPPRPHVAPGAKERVRIIVPISNILSGGKRYKGRVSVRGPTDAEIVLRIQVEELAHG